MLYLASRDTSCGIIRIVDRVVRPRVSKTRPVATKERSNGADGATRTERRRRSGGADGPAAEEEDIPNEDSR